MSAFTRILVPVDYSPPSSAALRVAGEIATAFGAHLEVLHLVPIEVYSFLDYPLIAPETARLDEERARLDAHVRVVLGEPAPPFETAVSWGSPFLQIVEHAIERRIDLIVIGTHGRTGIKHALLGSVVEKTVRLAPCPVLTVHENAVGMGALANGERSVPRSAGVPGQVSAVMTREPLVVSSTDTLEVASARMVAADARHLPVVDGQRLVGMLSDRDVQPHLGQLAHTRVNAAMTANPTTVERDASIAHAARRMLDAGVRALPVVDGERMIGIVTSTDILEDYILAARR